MNQQLRQSLDALEEAARLLGATQAKKAAGTYTEQDGRFEHAMYESIAKHKRAALAATEVAMRIGGKYNWKGQPERLIFLGRNWSGNGYWNQFALVEKPTVVWCEVLDADLPKIEETVTQQAAPKREFAKYQPCGCVVCTCEDDELCRGCGAKNCGTHAIGEFPNPVYKDQAQQAAPSQGSGELIRLLKSYARSMEYFGNTAPANALKAAAALLEASAQREQPAANRTHVDSGALTMAINVLRRSGKTEVADALEETAVRGEQPAASKPEPQAQAGEPMPVWNFGSDRENENGTVIVTILGSQHPEVTDQFITLRDHHEAMASREETDRRFYVTEMTVALAKKDAALAQAIHYPEHWDTAAYPTLADALHEVYSWAKCSECAPGSTPFYVIVGRIPGDDEDTALSVGQHATDAEAYAAFDRQMRELNPLTEEEAAAVQKQFGTDDMRVTYVIHTIRSDYPMEVL